MQDSIPLEYESPPDPHPVDPQPTRPEPEPALDPTPPGEKLLAAMEVTRTAVLPVLYQQIAAINLLLSQSERALYANDEDAMEALAKALSQ